ncbi:histidine-rich glycoprotein-like [Contarinia nasturtii]|uniref:histidine-rich glycoprotein-like n=1 Tax=Contarinia nasturtii TaxID=265458 RepID=UPI0012D41947|nr:histidine-rich glycoprotein-like [Contarinia nasturtii]
MKFILTIGLLIATILAQSYAQHEHHDDDSHPCAQPLYKLNDNKVGCLADIKKWYHNHASGKCEEFSFDGCPEHKNDNHFETEEECNKTCDEWHAQHKDHHHQEEHGDCKHGHDHAKHNHDAHDHGKHHH